MLKPCISSALLVALFVIQGCSQMQMKPGPAVAGTSPEIENTYRQSIQLMQKKQWKLAEAELSSFTGQYPQYSGPWLNLGIARMNLGDREAAESAFRTAIDRNRENPVAYNKLGILYRHSGQLDKALDMYELALKVSPDYPDTHWNIGILYDVYLSNADLALQHYIRYQQLTGSDDPKLKGWISTLQGSQT
jgi:tetratricopeptide (TPR) repeat protein